MWIFAFLFNDADLCIIFFVLKNKKKEILLLILVIKYCPQGINNPKYQISVSYFIDLIKLILLIVCN